MSARDEVLEANARFAASYAGASLPAAPARRLAVLTCMDARIDPAHALGLAAGDAHVLRNAGGLATDDALRSLAVSSALLGTREVLVIGHTDCGLLGSTNEELRAKVGAAAAGVDFAPFGDLEGSVRSSVRRIRESPLLPDGLDVSGWVFEVETGRIRPVDA